MKNAIKYILDRRDMKQQELVVSLYNKQYVSKVVNRHFRIPKALEEEWEKILRVPSEYFVDKKGLCKELNSLDIHKLDNFFNAQAYLEMEEELQKMPQTEIALRNHALSMNITKLQRNIRKDILSVPNEVTDAVEALNVQEYNYWFYKKVYDAHNNGHLCDDEWKSLFRAFSYVAENTAEDGVAEENALVRGVFALIKKTREENAQKQELQIQDYIELFGPIEPEGNE